MLSASGEENAWCCYCKCTSMLDAMLSTILHPNWSSHAQVTLCWQCTELQLLQVLLTLHACYRIPHIQVCISMLFQQCGGLQTPFCFSTCCRLERTISWDSFRPWCCATWCMIILMQGSCDVLSSSGLLSPASWGWTKRGVRLLVSQRMQHLVTRALTRWLKGSRSSWLPPLQVASRHR